MLIRITKLVLIIGLLISLYSCSAEGRMGIPDKDHYKAKETIESVLNAIQSDNKDQLKTLFSKSALSKIQSFDISAQELFDYYDGETKFYDDGAGPFVKTNKDEDQIYQLMESSFNVKQSRTNIVL